MRVMTMYAKRKARAQKEGSARTNGKFSVSLSLTSTHELPLNLTETIISLNIKLKYSNLEK